MTLYTKNRLLPSELPHRISLSNGDTRTGTFTDTEIADAGYTAVADPPAASPTQKCIWNGEAWQLLDKTDEDNTRELSEAWQQVRVSRDELITQTAWRIDRNLSETRLGLTTTDTLSDLDAYMQALRDITKASAPDNVVWPSLDKNESTSETSGGD